MLKAIALFGRKADREDGRAVRRPIGGTLVELQFLAPRSLKVFFGEAAFRGDRPERSDSAGIV
jgi:hypothetical protein